mmetsp:Transcript_7848/g.13221  ORF Transcript_7848/g.13221 Transcript_7848/m.13221 type:complete len:135 (+) Transcript_7848:166-570(+)
MESSRFLLLSACLVFAFFTYANAACNRNKECPAGLQCFNKECYNGTVQLCTSEVNGVSFSYVCPNLGMCCGKQCRFKNTDVCGGGEVVDGAFVDHQICSNGAAWCKKQCCPDGCDSTGKKCASTVPVKNHLFQM